MEQAVLGLIGAGYLANAQHLPNLVWAPHARLKTVCDIREEAAAAAQKKYNIPHVETDYRKVYADPEIQGVVIVTREDTHAPLTIEALEAGKHVYVEKPLADTRENCEKVVAAQEKTGKIVAVGFNRRFSPAYRKAKELLYAHGGPSNVHYRMADTYSYMWGKDYPPGVRIYHELCHVFDLFRWLTQSEPASVYCIDSRPDDEVLAIRMKSGCVCSVMSSGWASIDTPKERMEVVAEKGMVTIEHHVEMRTYGFPDAQDVYRFKGHAHPDLDFIHRWIYEDLGADAMRSFLKHWVRMVWHLKDRPIDDPADAAMAKDFAERHPDAVSYHVDKGWLQAMDHFAECIVTGAKPDTPDARDGLIAQLMGEAAAKSRETGRAVTFE